MACHDIGYMKKLIEQMLEGMNVHVQELKFRLTPPKDERRTIMRYSDGSLDLNDYNHWFLYVVSRITGKQWAIDIAGAQHGISIPGIPWIFAAEVFANQDRAFLPFGTLEKYATAMAQQKSLEGLEAGVQADAMKAFHGVVDMGMARKGLTWAGIFAKQEKDYVRRRDKVLRVGRKAIEDWKGAQSLTKRRVKAERYEKRHFGELLVEGQRFSDEILGKEMETVGERRDILEEKGPK